MICVSDFELDIILDIIKKYSSDCDVLAFGSRYKWTPKDHSDLDLAFVQKEGGKLGFNRIGDLKEAFSESDLPYRVDVLDYNAISPEFRAIIDRGNEVIYRKSAMQNVWRKVRLGDVCTKITSGGTPKSSNPDYYGGHIPWLRTQEIDFSNIEQTELYITEDGFNNSSAKWIPANAVIIAMYGATAGKSAISKIPLTTNQACCNLIVDDSKADYRYVFYYLKLEYVKLAGLANGGAQQNLNAKIISDFEISLPDLKIQRNIADTLSALDDKIINTEATNYRLEQMAQAVYTQMFPFEYGSKMPISNMIDVRDGTHDSPKAVEHGFPLVTSKHLLPYGVDLITPNHISKVDFDKINERSQVDRRDILISMIGTIGLISLVIERDINFAIKNVGLFKTSQNEEWVYFVLCFLRSSEAKNHIDMRLAGSTQKYISLGELRQLPVSVPASDKLKVFNDFVCPIFEEIIRRTEESTNLATIRDTLLPRLMSGELSVTNVMIK